MTVQSEDNRTM